MFSDALRKLDENTVNYMIEMLKDDLIKMGNVLKEKDSALEEKDSIIEAREHALEKKDREIEVRDNMIKRMEQEIAELRNSSSVN